MASELRVDKIHNEGGDNDSGINLATNDNVKIDIAGSTKLTKMPPAREPKQMRKGRHSR